MAQHEPRAIGDGLLRLTGRGPITSQEFHRACDTLGLAPRYRWVLWQYLAGLSIAEMVKLTPLSRATVRTYLRDLCWELSCCPGVEAGHYASRTRLQDRLGEALDALST